MKKVFLLIALTLVSAGAVRGMEKPEEFDTRWSRLPGDIGRKEIVANVKPFISMIIEQSNDLDSAIKSLKSPLSEIFVNKQLYDSVQAYMKNLDLARFTALAHLLANKFKTSTEWVAHKFGIPIAKQYIELGNKLEETGNNYVGGIINKTEMENTIKNLINSGADVNFTLDTGLGTGSPVMAHIFGLTVGNDREGLEKSFPKYKDLVQVFLKYGAIPNSAVINWFNGKVEQLNEFGNPSSSTQKEIDEIEKMLKNVH